MGKETLAKAQQIIGYFDIAQGRLAVKRVPTGNDFIRAGKMEDATSGLISIICTLNDRPLTIAEIQEFDSAVNIALEEEIIRGDHELATVHDEEDGTYFFFSDKPDEHITFVERKISDDNYAQKISMGDPNSLALLLISRLMRVNGEKLRHDKILDMELGRIQLLLPLIMPKKIKFVRVKP